ncbi:MAG TPA: M56 family metallopeptidase [Prevotella sp.]
MAIYLLKINIALIILYGFYRMMFGRDTFFGWRRTLLLGIYIIALCIPLFSIEAMISQNETTAGMAQAYAEVMLPQVTVGGDASTFSWTSLAWAVYLLGAALLSVRFAVQLTHICLLAYRSTPQIIEGTTVHTISRKESPFSFFGWIFLYPSGQSPAQLHEILVHERTHVQQLHSLDVLIAELFAIICWFNPFVWLLRREVRINLEYLADSNVIANGSDQKAYQYHLLGLAYQKNRTTITNNFNVLPLKKRIKMMNKRRTHEIGKAKYLLFAPLAAALLVVSNIETVARNVSKQLVNVGSAAGISEILPEQTAPSAAAKADTIINGKRYRLVEEIEKGAANMPNTKGEVFEVVEEMPMFPGGNLALMNYLAKSIKYPEAAKKAGKQGRVTVSFIVMQDGTVTNAVVSRSVLPELDAEALRIVKAMPKWIPGKQNGKYVNVRYMVPITFRLYDTNTSANHNDGEKNITETSFINAKFTVNGKEVQYDQIKDIASENIEAMRVDKKENTIHITLK